MFDIQQKLEDGVFRFYVTVDDYKMADIIEKNLLKCKLAYEILKNLKDVQERKEQQNEH
jgi:hypothetical protein